MTTVRDVSWSTNSCTIAKRVFGSGTVSHIWAIDKDSGDVIEKPGREKISSFRLSRYSWTEAEMDPRQQSLELRGLSKGSAATRELLLLRELSEFAILEDGWASRQPKSQLMKFFSGCCRYGAGIKGFWDNAGNLCEFGFFIPMRIATFDLGDFPVKGPDIDGMFVWCFMFVRGSKLRHPIFREAYGEFLRRNYPRAEWLYYQRVHKPGEMKLVRMER